MGPTNLALVNLFRADQTLREAQGRLDAASKNVRIQERRVHDLEEKLRAGQQRLKEIQAKSMAADVDLKGRDARIEKLREQQQSAKNDKEYRTFLVEINTAKVDRSKAEEEALKLVAQLEAQQKELAELARLLEQETAKLNEMRAHISQDLAALNAEIEQIRPTRQAAADEVGKLSAKALGVYERLAERYDGEAMAPIAQPDKRREQTVCTACNMELVIDIFNKLKTRDDMVFCPNCGRMLYVPEGMATAAPPKPKPAKERATPTKRAAATREPGMPVDPVKAELHRLLSRAAGESTKNAVAAGNSPIEIEVFVEGRFFGVYKGQTLDNYRKTARFCLHEAGIIKAFEVYPKGEGPKPAPVSVALPSGAQPGSDQADRSPEAAAADGDTPLGGATPDASASQPPSNEDSAVTPPDRTESAHTAPASSS